MTTGGLLTDAAASELEGAISRWRRAHLVPGLAVAVADLEGRRATFTDGLADVEANTAVAPGHRFQIGSIGKLFTSVSLLRLAERGLIDLDAPVARYLRWFRAEPFTRAITLHHLLTHTAGLPIGADFSDTSPFDAWAVRYAPALPPGTRYWYSNAGYKALGLVLEKVLDRPYGSIIQEEVLEPLGMAATSPIVTLAGRDDHAVGYEPEPDVFPVARAPRVRAPFIEVSTGDGSVAATADDVAIFAQVLLEGRAGLPPRGRAGTLLSPASLERLFGRHVRTGRGKWYGYAISTRSLDGRIVAGHGGDMIGFRATLLTDPAAGIAIVVLTNGRGAPTPRLAEHALRVARADRARRPWPAFDPWAAVRPVELAGAYTGEAASMTIEAATGDIRMIRAGRSLDLIARAEDAFDVDDPVAGRFVLRFERDRRGRIVRATHGPASFVRGPAVERAQNPVTRSRAELAGHYRSHNPWRRSLDVIVRDRRLVLVEADGEEDPLVRLGGGRFRPGLEPNPEWITFDAFVERRPLRLTGSGEAYYRDGRDAQAVDAWFSGSR